MDHCPYVVITGAHGFIGNHILERMLMSDLDALLRFGLDDESESQPPRTAQVRFSQQSLPRQTAFDVWSVDLPEAAARATAHRFAQSSRVKIVFQKELLAQLTKAEHPPLAVIHNGACSSTVERNPAVFAELNVGASQELWMYCAEKNVPFIYASSAAVYGDGSLGFSDRPEFNSKYRPLNLYGQSKLDFDLWASAQEKSPPYWFGLRYFNVYGPFESHKGGQASMVFHGYQQATRNGLIRLFRSNTAEYGDGQQVRDFVYVKDIVRVTLHLLGLALRGERPAAWDSKMKGCFVNVGTGGTRSWNDLASAVFSALSLPERIEYIDIPENIAGQYQNYTCAELSTLRSLDFRHSFTSLETGVREYVQRYLMRGL